MKCKNDNHMSGSTIKVSFTSELLQELKAHSQVSLSLSDDLTFPASNTKKEKPSVWDQLFCLSPRKAPCMSPRNSSPPSIDETV